jgi:azurin
MSNQLTKQPGEPRRTGLRRARGYLFGLAILLGLVAAGCSQGSYPLDIFYEMHYQQSYKSHEPPRLSAPASSVAWYPGPESTSFNDGRHLYMVNCAMCHGLTGQGDGPVLQTLINTYGYKPAVDADLTSDQAKAIGPGGILGFMRSGVVVMPNFSKLLSAGESSAIVEYITGTLAPAPAGTTPEGQPPAAAPAPTQAPAPSAGPGPLEIGVNGDALTFDKESFEVASGSEVVLAFNNASGINQHNWVVVQAGTKDAVSQRGTAAGPGNDWLQPGDADVVANTKVLSPGESGEVRFTAPAPGAYQFVCTFPGHNFTMFGDFVVTP